VVAGTDGFKSPSVTPSDNLLGRRVRASLSTPSPGRSGRAAGGAPAISYDVRGDPASYPPAGTGSALTGYNSFFGLRHRRAAEPGPWYNPGGVGGAYGGGWADGVGTVRDRHIIVRRGTVRNPGGGGSSMPSADLCGPPPPRYQMVNTTESWQQGTDKTTQEDNPGPHYTVPRVGQPGRLFPLGQQDGNQTHVMGPPIGEYRDYGVRGPAGMHGPTPASYALAGDGSGARVGTLLAEGEPGSEPTGRLIYGGVPHGLHSPTIASRIITMARQAAIPQMVAPRVDRPASSKAAGQSFSQTVVPEAQAGSGGRTNATPRMPAPGRAAGVMARFVVR
jgi:hypothetical protein